MAITNYILIFMNSIIISVIIPTYKPQSYIIKCLDSLCNQTFPKERFEVIIVLNGPKVPYYQQLEHYACEHNTKIDIKILYSKKTGVSLARNIGINESHGKYIIFIDDDDFISEKYIEQMLASADEDCVCVSNAYALDDTSGKEYEYFLSKEYQKLSLLETPSLFRTRRVLSPAWCKLIPKKIIAYDRFPTDFALGEDSIFMFTISKRIKEVRFAPSDAIYYIRHRAGSASRRHYNYLYRIIIAFRTSLRYTCIYIKSPFSYNFMFFISRIAATLRKLIRRAYETE